MPEREPDEVEDDGGDLFDEIEERVARNMPRPYLAHLLDLEVCEAKREIFVVNGIEDDFAGWFTKVFRRLLSLSHEPITIWLKSPMMDVLSFVPPPSLVGSAVVENRLTAAAQGVGCSGWFVVSTISSTFVASRGWRIQARSPISL